MSPDTAAWLALLIPALGALGIAATGRSPNIREGVTLVSAALLFVTVVSILPSVLAGERPEVTIFEVLPGLPIRLEVEPLGMTFALVASFLWIVNSLYSIGYMRGNAEHSQTRFYICFAIALSSTMGVAFAGNLLTLFICYEVLSLSTYPLVTHKESPDAVRAGRTYLGILLSTSIGLMFLAIIWTWVATGTVDFREGGILAGKVEGPEVVVLLFLYMYGIGKAALMPVHRWLPAAMVAPTPVSALLHAVAVVKAGVFSVVKVIVYVFGIDLLVATPGTHWLFYMAGATIIIASVIALRSDNLKRRLAYSTVSQLSYVIFAAAILAPLSVMGAAIHIAAHAFGKITLFFAAGSIYTAAHKTEVSQLDGIGRRMPITMAAFAIGSLSMIGVPPTAGFVSKWFMVQGALEVQNMLAIIVIVVSTLLNASYFLPIVYAAYFRKPAPVEAEGEGGQDAEHQDEAHCDAHDHGEAPWPIVVALSITAAGTILMFFLPQLPLELANDLVGGGP